MRASWRFYLCTLIISCWLHVPAFAQAQGKCAIVYGKDWSFLFSAPDHWNVACPVKDQSGVAVALWPDDAPWKNAKAVMYVTVSNKDDLTLEQFSEDELARSRADSPQLSVEKLDPIHFSNSGIALLRALSGDRFGSHELVAYADIGQAYLILVLTSHDQQSVERLRGDFEALVTSIKPMTIQFSEGAKSGAPVVKPANP
jgi:hypothetical protein